MDPRVAIVVKAHPVYDSLIRFKPKESGPGAPDLGMGRNRTHFNKTEAKSAQTFYGLRALIKARGEPDRIGKR